MTMYRVYTIDDFNELLPWSLDDTNWLWRGSYEVLRDTIDKADFLATGFVIMRESNEHLDFIEEVEL